MLLSLTRLCFSVLSAIRAILVSFHVHKPPRRKKLAGRVFKMPMLENNENKQNAYVKRKIATILRAAEKLECSNHSSFSRFFTSPRISHVSRKSAIWRLSVLKTRLGQPT